jgi:hypothetical protein
MGKRIDIILPEELVSKLQREAGRRIGAKRGAFTEAVTDAISLWLDPKVIEIIEKNSNLKLNQETKEILKKYSGANDNA